MAYLLGPGRRAVMWHEATKSFYEVWVERPIAPADPEEYPDRALSIVHDISKIAEISPTLVLNMQHRTPPITLARSVACYIIRHKTHFTWKRIAATFGSADAQMASQAFNRVSIMLRSNADERVKVVPLIQKAAPELLLT